MAGEPNLNDPSPFPASKSRNLQNPPPISPPSPTHIPRCRFQGPPQALSQAPHTSQQLSSHDLRSRLGNFPLQQSSREEPQESKQQYEEEEEEEGKNEGEFSEQGNSSMVKRCQPHTYAQGAFPSAQENPRVSLMCVGSKVLESSKTSVGNGSPDASVEKASFNEDGLSSSDGSSRGESETANQQSDGSSSGKDMIKHLSLHNDAKGQVSPLRALSHIAHIKRKQDCLQTDVEESWPHASKELAGNVLQASSSKRKKLKLVQFQLEPVAYQKLMTILVEQHQGSFERFIMATLDSSSMEQNSVKSAAIISRKPAFSKWKRTRFDQLKGNETEELALAFRSLAESTPNVDVTPDLMHVPWQELNMLQLQKMLEETKKMLLIHEKVHDCPVANCDRRFSTPGSLKDHLNEHSGEQPYTCTFEDCSHRFRSKQHLCRHLKKHEQAHTCTFEGCNKRFAFRERLIVHQKIHSDERPLSCPWDGCGKTFKWANSLHGHMRTHTGEKPFQCTFAGCGRLFGYKVDLTRHRRTHFGQPARANH